MSESDDLNEEKIIDVFESENINIDNMSFLDIIECIKNKWINVY